MAPWDSSRTVVVITPEKEPIGPVANMFRGRLFIEILLSQPLLALAASRQTQVTHLSHPRMQKDFAALALDTIASDNEDTGQSRRARVIFLFKVCLSLVSV